ncbi:cytochrome c biogenesis protein CcsA [Salegentibacter sp. F188]|uniref:Cytochrome c biogenesis protein CcsA n=1 Tax=Autumnicola patrickiae TaxID=3075591 RepID=A0ABU3DX89_9FLAO|nr:cytochrome c biogenesis protein CcsA [Salegentibacter sp. F188]MDT0688258.1 cytochrome c biogenesis protein CcsA [Salegentibacter sp. F188]
MKLVKFLFSTKVSFLLIIAFAGAMGVATFIENDYGTAVAREAVYEAWWFEVIMIWLAVNFIAHIKKYKLFTKKRWPLGVFHIAFVVMILGAGVTRYFGKEGVIHIREGEVKNTFYSAGNFMQLQGAGEDGTNTRFEKPLELSNYKFKPQTVTANVENRNFNITVEEYIKGAHKEFVAGKDTLIEVVVASGKEREDYLISKGDDLPIGELRFSTSGKETGNIRVFKQDSLWMIYSDKNMHVVEMTNQNIGILKAGETLPLQMRSLYQVDSAAFMIKGIYEGNKLVYHAEEDPEIAEELPDVVKLRVTNEAGYELLSAFSPLVSRDPQRHMFFVDGQKYSLAYGPREEVLPFALKLREFELERYPGSQSAASYASELQVIDHETNFPFRIFMNNVLDYKGYRFYQASYDTDEKGTVLSVSQDRPGTYITYFSYTLLTVGMFFTLFVKGSRFSILNRRLKTLKDKESGKSKIKNKKRGGEEVLPKEPTSAKPRISIPRFTTIALLAIILSLFFGLQAYAHEQVPDVSETVVPLEQAEAYGSLVVQDLDGRMKPLNTLANEITRKLSGSSTITIKQPGGEITLTAEQFLLAMQLDPGRFSVLPLIKVDAKKADAIFKAINHAPVSSISFQELIDEDGRYLLQDLVEEANRLKPAERNEAHKELLKVDERFNIFYAILRGDFLKLFPNRLDQNNTWFAANQFKMGFDEEDALFVKNITPLYLSAIGKGIASGNWSEAAEVLSYIHLFQQKAGEEVYPGEEKIQTEILYNKLNLGNRLFGIFWVLGIAMLILAIIKLFNQPKWLKYSWNTGLILAWAGLVVFTIHLLLRWYIAGRAPWSDGFEMLVFVAWCILLFGLLFGKKSHFTVPLGILFSGTLLFVAFLDWLNPEITNLMPVLHSYWLKIHVAIIVSGYAPLALAALLALLSLVLLIFKPVKPSKKWWRSMQELSMVNEMSITIGLFLLAVGTFLGGVWANESWGRYWAWDPKETWALISVMVYAFVLHLRLVPKLKNSLVLNIASLWAFSSIIMTSFGVNYYLSGLHSYASGDPVPIPGWVYWMVAILLVITVLAIVRYKKLSQLEKKDLMAV